MEYTWTIDSSTNTGRLTQIKDPVSQLHVDLLYAVGPQGCAPNPGAVQPAGMLCQVTYPDGSMTLPVYNANGQLTQIQDPGNEITDFAYGTNGLLAKVRSSLAADMIGAGQRVDNDSARTLINYDSSPLPRVSDVSAPAATFKTRTSYSRPSTFTWPPPAVLIRRLSFALRPFTITESSSPAARRTSVRLASARSAPPATEGSTNTFITLRCTGQS